MLHSSGRHTQRTRQKSWRRSKECFSFSQIPQTWRIGEQRQTQTQFPHHDQAQMQASCFSRCHKCPLASCPETCRHHPRATPSQVHQDLLSLAQPNQGCSSLLPKFPTALLPDHQHPISTSSVPRSQLSRARLAPSMGAAHRMGRGPSLRTPCDCLRGNLRTQCLEPTSQKAHHQSPQDNQLRGQDSQTQHNRSQPPARNSATS